MRLILVLLMLLHTAPASAQSKRAYVCTGTQSTGFIGGTERRAVGFAPRPFTLVLDGAKATVKRAGSTKDDVYQCRFTYELRAELITCNSPFDAMIFDLAMLRFTRAYLFGYVDGGDDTLSVEYGDCQRM
jgi:hypothetical protein